MDLIDFYPAVLMGVVLLAIIVLMVGRVLAAIPQSDQVPAEKKPPEPPGPWEAAFFCAKCNAELTNRQVFRGDEVCPHCGEEGTTYYVPHVKRVRRAVFKPGGGWEWEYK